jgi:hypothetical protein
MEKVARVRSALANRESRSNIKSALQTQANAADDVLYLLSKAEQKGLPSQRAEILRSRVNRLPGLPPARVRKIETTLRTWIRRREL